MAQLYPSMNVILESKQKPTEGELFLLNRVVESFDPDVKVFFQPFFNGERPDIIIIHEWKGVIIIEVKDWELSSYYLDISNKWHVRCNDSVIRSPFNQVFNYKKNMFDLHINGLLEKSIKNKKIYSTITCYVYFHKADSQILSDFYAGPITYYEEKINECNIEIANSNGDRQRYFNDLEYVRNRLDKFKRDLDKIIIHPGSINKIKFPIKYQRESYPIEVYEGFLRYLIPPYHYSHEGKSIPYSEAQKKLSISTSGAREKIKGVAGSGKTTVLAQRAVNAHKRHGCKVLILTFNLTLKMYIKSRINEVREDFSWGVFAITNYHQFMSSALSEYGVEINIPDEIKDSKDKEKISEYLERNYYSNDSVFDGISISDKYKTILVDEVQDYKSEWVKIVRKFFLESNGEMILFGDEKQNIYEREIDSDKTSKTVQGFGRWNVLNKSYRFKEDSHILSLAKRFQSTFFAGRYNPDYDDVSQPSLLGLGVNQCLNYSESNLKGLVSYVFLMSKQESIHPNDIVILSSNIAQMRDIDYLIRKNPEFNERTLTTFETKEAREWLRNDRTDIERIRKIKKTGFNQNSGVLKVSTIHSYKGYESPTVFLILNEDDSPELVYVGITRARFNLVLFFKENSKYSNFFKGELEFTNIP